MVPFLKVVNDTAVAVNQGGKRKGAVCAYLETWHLDIEEFLELRKNTGDDRRRTHDMNTANWIPDLFMQRVDGRWRLDAVLAQHLPDLHDKFGKCVRDRLRAPTKPRRDRGEIKLFKRMPARDLWRKMLTMLFETGHPWITFKDACNVRSPQQHVGVVHSSNLCTEITLNTSETEIAVCNLGSVNLAAAPERTTARIDQDKLKRTIATAMRMLDNVIDINYYAVKKARDSNLRHRPVGLGIMGFQDALYELRMPYASRRGGGVCRPVDGSGVLPRLLGVDRTGRGTRPVLELPRLAVGPRHPAARHAGPAGRTARRLRRGRPLDHPGLGRAARSASPQHGMRNSNCVAIAPTATISNIIGVDASIEPCFGNLSVKSNLSGEFTIVNEYLVRDLKKLGLWDDVMVMDLKHFDGSLRPIDRVPEEIKALYATAFEVEPQWLVEAAARRQKWIDQAQSLNIYMAGASGKKLDDTYKLAWLRGLKTTYYLRTMGATHVEMSTVNRGGLTTPSAREAAALPPDSPSGARHSGRASARHR